MKRRGKHGLAVWMIGPVMAACGSGPIAACEAWRSHLHGGESASSAVEAATASNNRVFADAVAALTSDKATNNQVRLVVRHMCRG